MKEKKLTDEVIKQVEEAINDILEQKVQPGNADYLYKLIDIHKDIKNEEYWKEEENMNYGNYGNYGRDEYGNYDSYGARMRDSRGRYMARGYDSRYRGHDHLDRMSDEYGRYMENRERYGAGEETDKSYHYMVEALKDFIKVLHEEAETPQQKQMLSQALQSSMR